MSYSKELIASLEAKGQLLRKDCIKCIGVGVAGHVGGSCSSADIMAALYFYKMKYDCKNPEWDGRDYFLLSKGHVAILQYSALAEAGFFPVEDRSAFLRTATFVLLGTPEPLLMLQAFLIRTAAGGVLVMKLKLLSAYTVMTTGMIFLTAEKEKRTTLLKRAAPVTSFIRIRKRTMGKPNN